MQRRTVREFRSGGGTKGLQTRIQAINPVIRPSGGIITGMVARNLQNQLIQLLEANAAVILTNPRQVDKTTLALSLQDSQDIVYRDLENPRELGQVRDIELFVQ